MLRLRLRRRTERGATLVEYVLLVAVLAVGTVGGLSALRDGAAATTEQTAAEISSQSRPSVTLPPDGGGGGGGATTTTSTTTTAAPTTTTSTTSTTTTTIAPATEARTTMSELVAESSANGQEWRALTELVVVDQLDRPVPGATVTIEMRFRGPGTSLQQPAPDLVGTTAAAGRLEIDSGWFNANGETAPRAEFISFRIVSVDAPGLVPSFDGSWNEIRQP